MSEPFLPDEDEGEPEVMEVRQAARLPVTTGRPSRAGGLSIRNALFSRDAKKDRYSRMRADPQLLPALPPPCPSATPIPPTPTNGDVGQSVEPFVDE